MSTIKFIDVLACSSEDPSNQAKGLLRSGRWLSHVDDKETIIEVILKMEKEQIISFIDIGNHGSLSFEVMVSHSLRTKGDFVSLVPKCMLMTVAESKQFVNINQVHMFRKDQMLSSTREQTWDTIKLICSQPYLRPKRNFGLSFFSAKSISNSPSPNTSSNNILSPSPMGISRNIKEIIVTPSSNRSKLKSIFQSESSESDQESTRLTMKLNKTPSLSSSSLSTSSLSTSSETPGKKLLTPTSNKSDKLKIFSPAAKAQFLNEVECFLNGINFKDLIKSNKTIKVSDLREQLESQRRLKLSRFQKKLFLEKIKSIMEEEEKSEVTSKSPDQTIDEMNGIEDNKEKNEEANTVNKSRDQLTPRLKKKFLIPALQKTNSIDMSCKYCKALIPQKVLAIHESICSASTNAHNEEVNDHKNVGNPEKLETLENPDQTEPPTKKIRYRNSLCFDTNDDVENEPPKKKFSDTKLFSNAINSIEKSQRISPKDLANHLNSNNIKKEASFGSNTKHFQTKTESFASSNNRPRQKTVNGSHSPSFLIHSASNLKPIQSIAKTFKTQNFIDPCSGKTNLPVKQRAIKSKEFSVDDVIPCPTALSENGIIRSPTNRTNTNSHIISIQDSPEKDSKFRNENNFAKPNNNKPKSITSEKTQQCPICEEYISVYTIGLHAAMCNGKKSFSKVVEVSPEKPPSINIDNPSISDNEPVYKTEYSLCPVCSLKFNTDILQYHVNICLDTMS